MPDRDAAAQAYRPDIDGLRGLAVILVVAYHALPSLRTGGFVGVDVFFVISGFLITQLVLAGLQARTFSLAEFYRRRVRRIVPALLVVLTTCCIAAWFLLLPGELQWFGRSLWRCAAFLANVFFATTGGYFDPAKESFPLLHLWSLGVEEQFYLVWPVLLMLAAKYGVTERFLVIAIAASLLISIWGGWYSPVQFFYYPVSRGWELAVGGLLAARQLGAPRKRIVNASSNLVLQISSLVGLTLIIAGGVFWTPDKPVPGVWSVLPTTGAALLIAAGGRAPVNRWFLGNRLMIFVGKISYPLYLWHWPLFSFTRIVLGHTPQAGLAAAECVIAFVAAYATYRWVEVPIRYGSVSRRAVPALLIGLTCLAPIGVGAARGWITGRLSGPTVAAWDAAVRDWNFPSETKFGEFRFGVAAVPGHGPGKAVFIGDSHLQQYWPRMGRVIENHGDTARSIVLVTRAGCPMLPGLEVRGRGRHCNEHFKFAMEQALKPDVDTVVFGAFWEDYFLGEYSGRRPRPQVYSAADNAHKTLAIDSPGTQIAFEQFQAVISELVASGRRVYIVLSNPTSPLFEPHIRPELRISPHASGSIVAGKGVLLDAAPFESYVAPLTNRLRDIAARSGAKVIDPRLTLCDGMICPANDSNGLPRYIDSNHLRGFAAAEYASFIDETLLGRN